jgi:hypothetical protein
MRNLKEKTMHCDICGKDKPVLEIYGVTIVGVNHICLSCMIDNEWGNRGYYKGITHCKTCGKTAAEPACTYNEIHDESRIKCRECREREAHEAWEEEQRQWEIEREQERQALRIKMERIYFPLTVKLTVEQCKEFDLYDPYPGKLTLIKMGRFLTDEEAETLIDTLEEEFPTEDNDYD